RSVATPHLQRRRKHPDHRTALIHRRRHRLHQSGLSVANELAVSRQLTVNVLRFLKALRANKRGLLSLNRIQRRRSEHTQSRLSVRETVLLVSHSAAPLQRTPTGSIRLLLACTSQSLKLFASESTFGAWTRCRNGRCCSLPRPWAQLTPSVVPFLHD